MEQVSAGNQFLHIHVPGSFFCRVQNFNPLHGIPLFLGVSGLVKKNLDYCTPWTLSFDLSEVKIRLYMLMRRFIIITIHFMRKSYVTTSTTSVTENSGDSTPSGGKQTLCMLSFVYTSQVNLTVWTEPKFG